MYILAVSELEREVAFQIKRNGVGLLIPSILSNTLICNLLCSYSFLCVLTIEYRFCNVVFVRDV